ncbi:MAG: bifunctional [glutamate--ammonia ligase]-adenylyl-L-tyrosine phosphorylase/[glutamate--ammonia-ligase] adenylyltransferase, partial [Gammaproteobacteria bacterium]
LSVLIKAVTSEEVLQRALRRLRRREFVRIAWRDLSGWVDLQETVHDLSQFADCSILAVLNLLHQWQMRLLGEPVDEAGNVQSLLVIALGKLGGGELNFSSDIDLSFAFPVNGEIHNHGKILSYEQYFIRLARRFIRVFSANTQDGFVFRVDMRLRPYGDAGPLVMSFSAMETYYQEQGRDWERYALVKARVLTEDKQYRQQLAGIIRPFVYRRYLDYSAIVAMRNIKRLLARQVKVKGLQQDIKRGAGGIRQIEFIVQTLQLIRGGQVVDLQTTSIFEIFIQLQQQKILTKEIVEKLRQAYEFLRRLEHVLQMIADKQTHELPVDKLEQVRIAYALGFKNWQALKKVLETWRKFVKNNFEKMLAQEKSQIEKSSLDEQVRAMWLGEVNEIAAKKILQRLGFKSADETFRLLKKFHSSRRCRQASQLSRSRLDVLMPVLLRLSAQCDPSTITLQRVLHLLEAVIRRSTYLVLLWEKNQTLQHLMELLSKSEWIAEQVIAHPQLLDELLHTKALYKPQTKQALIKELDQTLAQLPEQDLEMQTEALCVFKLAQQLRVAAADVSGTLPLMQVSDHLTHVAEVIIQKVKQLAMEEIHHKYAQSASEILPEEDFIIIAYGKLGGIELSYDSDLDLVFLHNNLAADPQITLRLAQRILHLLTVRTHAGLLYRVDPRLRPSGASGLLVSHIDAFIEYQQKQAWTWEHQALVRARVVSGGGKIEVHFNAARRSILQRQRDQCKLRQEVVNMRVRMRAANEVKQAGCIDIRQCAGGVTD